MKPLGNGKRLAVDVMIAIEYTPMLFFEHRTEMIHPEKLATMIILIYFDIFR